ncbi:MAG TPA: arylesterase [Stellaceae bacterium]|nr:arylesterase [Stellaceae bacterium]
MCLRRNVPPRRDQRDVAASGRRRVAHLLAGLGLMWASGHGPAAAAVRVPVILAFGDSLTAGLGLPQNEAFPAQLQARLAALGVTARVVNAGISGDTTADGRARLDWALADKPDLVILELGANDMLRGIDPQLTRGNLAAMIAEIRKSGAKVLLAGMKAAPNWGARYQKSFDRIYPELAQEDHVALYPFFLDGVAMDPALNQADGLHPTAKGVAVVADRIAPYVVRLIGGRP